ncbi:MAG: hypothetical protein WB699_19545, partial [Bacteroidota bacterium]
LWTEEGLRSFENYGRNEVGECWWILWRRVHSFTGRNFNGAPDRKVVRHVQNNDAEPSVFNRDKSRQSRKFAINAFFGPFGTHDDNTSCEVELPLYSAASGTVRAELGRFVLGS